MTKQLFLNELSAALHGLPREERYRTLSYYDELIDDRMEDGQSEEDAVESLGSPEQIAREILGEEEPPVSTGTGRKVWMIILFQLGMSVALLGLAVLSALGFYFTGKVTVKAGRAIWRWIRRSFAKKGRVVA